MSDVKDHLLGGEHKLEFEDGPARDGTSARRQTFIPSFLKSPSLQIYVTIAAYTWAILCTIPALLFFVRLADHVCSVRVIIRKKC